MSKEVVDAHFEREMKMLRFFGKAKGLCGFEEMMLQSFFSLTTQ